MNNNENISAVTKGLEYEDRVVRALQSWGLDAHRTNTSNPDDPEEYKHGFDGGVDIIARYSVDGKVKKDLTFYIQCKDHKKELTKSAVSEDDTDTGRKINHHIIRADNYQYAGNSNL